MRPLEVGNVTIRCSWQANQTVDNCRVKAHSGSSYTLESNPFFFDIDDRVAIFVIYEHLCFVQRLHADTFAFGYYDRCFIGGYELPLIFTQLKPGQPAQCRVVRKHSIHTIAILAKAGIPPIKRAFTRILHAKLSCLLRNGQVSHGFKVVERVLT